MRACIWSGDTSFDMMADCGGERGVLMVVLSKVKMDVGDQGEAR